MTEFKASRYYHVPVGRFNTIWRSDILNFQLENTILLGEDPTSGWKIEIHPAEARSFAGGRLRSTWQKVSSFWQKIH
jgi:hypothetical protein